MEIFPKEQQSPPTSPYPLEIQAIALNERVITELDCDPTAEVKEVWS